MNLFDIIVIAVVLLSALLAFMRGLVSEVLSVGGWIGAAVATLFLFPHLQPILRQHIHSPIAADVAAVGGIFLGTLIVLTIVSHQVAKLVRGSPLSAVDRSLGFVFGVARGVVLVSIGYLLLMWLVPPVEQPEWIKEARSRPLVETGASLLRGLLPESLRDGATGQADLPVQRARQEQQNQTTLQGLTTTRPQNSKPAPPPDAVPYKTRDQADMQRMINNVQTNR